METTITLNTETGACTYNVTTTARVSHETLLEVLENNGTRYWASDAQWDGSRITWWEQEAHRYNEDGTQTRRHSTTWERLAEALVSVAAGDHGLRDDLEEEAREILSTGDAAGCEVCDCVIQVALFGKVVYG